jgi:hypothetical protein
MSDDEWFVVPKTPVHTHSGSHRNRSLVEILGPGQGIAIEHQD